MAGRPGPAGEPALAVEDLTAGYGGVIALRGVSVSAGQGTITTVLGANGAGKTTLLRAISGQVRVRRGSVRLDGADVTRRRPDDLARAGVAHVPEGQGVITELTVEENLRLGALCPPGRAGRGIVLALGKVVASADAATRAGEGGLLRHYLGL